MRVPFQGEKFMLASAPIFSSSIKALFCPLENHEGMPRRQEMALINTLRITFENKNTWRIRELYLYWTQHWWRKQMPERVSSDPRISSTFQNQETLLLRCWWNAFFPLVPSSCILIWFSYQQVEAMRNLWQDNKPMYKLPVGTSTSDSRLLRSIYGPNVELLERETCAFRVQRTGLLNWSEEVNPPTACKVSIWNML